MDMDNFENEELFPVGTELVAATNKRMGAKIITLSAAMDAARIGVVCRNGERLVLESLRCGKRKWTSVEAVVRWARAAAKADAAGLAGVSQ